MLVHIIPCLKLPRQLSVFSYLAPASLSVRPKIGQLAVVPFRRSLVPGVIVRIDKKKNKPARQNFPLKNLLSLAHPEPLFTPAQIKFFSALADFYCLSPSLFFYFSLPKILAGEWPEENRPLNFAGRQNRPSRPSFFWWHNEKEKKERYLSLIKKNTKEKKQTLFIVPRLNNIAQLARELGLAPEDYLPAHHLLSRAQKTKNWFAALRPAPAEPLIFIGTKTALFYPYTRLGRLIVDQENSPDHKQTDLNPRYAVSEAAPLISSIYGCDLLFSSRLPSLNAYFSFSLEKNKEPSGPRDGITLVDLNDEVAQKNFSFISEAAQKAIGEQINVGQKTFIFLNRKGLASLVACQNCGFIFRCPRCQKPYLPQNDSSLFCPVCRLKDVLPPFCPGCNGTNFRFSGLGLEKIASYLKKIFPAADILKINAGDVNNQQKQNEPCHIVIGTEYALPLVDWPKTGLTVIIKADQLWTRPEYRSAEQAYGLLNSILTLNPPHAKIIIQSFHPSHHVIRSLVSDQPGLFYEQELRDRKKFAYPPFGHLLKITVRGRSLEKTQKSLQEITQIIAKNIPALKDIHALPPERQKKYFQGSLILKNTDLALLRQSAKFLPDDCLIDIDPYSLKN